MIAYTLATIAALALAVAIPVGLAMRAAWAGPTRVRCPYARRDLTVRIEEREILKGVNLIVPKGEVHAIMGRNGSGKSTLSYVLAGKEDYEITGGEVLLDGVNILEMEPSERATAGLFLAFQYPIEIPGVATMTFLKAALNAKRKANGEGELSTPDFMKAVKEAGKASKAGNGAENNDDAQAEGTEAKKNQNNEEENANNELEGNEGEIQRPAVVDLQFRGSPTGKVVAMPKFLRVLYGDAKAGQNGPKNAKASWTCTGFEDKVLMDKYPICPQNSKVKRVHDFPSCWDGKNIDSANHRDHIVFPDQNGKCKKGFKAVPQLRISLTYNIPQNVQKEGRYLVDSFPEEEHNPLTDHDDFANVMSQQIMNRLVNCVNTGKKCRE